MPEIAAIDPSKPSPAITRMGSDIARDEQLYTRRSSDLIDKSAQISAEREKVLAPMEQQLQQSMAEPDPQRPKTEIPQFKPQPIVDAKDYEALSYGLIAMAMIGGVASQGKWLEVGATLNGALKGYLDGNVQVAEKRYKDYEEQFKGAMAKEAQANREFEDILKNKHMRIQDQINQYRIVAAKYDRQDALVAAQSRSLEQMWRSIESRKTAMAKLEDSHQRTVESFELRRELYGPGPGGQTPLTPEGNKVYNELVRAGLPIPKTRRGQVDYERLNSLGSEEAGGAGSGALAGGRADYKAKSAALAQNTKDLAAIRPYNDMLHTNGDIAIQLAEKSIATDTKLANKTLNWARQNIGDNPDVAEFLAQAQIVSTESARVLNNPRLVGQLTDSARHEMEGIINGDMPLKSFTRVIRRMQADGNNRVAAMVKEHDKLLKDLGSRSTDSAPVGSGAPSPAQLSAGHVEGGYRFKGGDPSKQENWEKQ